MAAAACVAAALAPASPALAEPPITPDAGAYTTDAPVYTLARAGGRTYIGGDFTRVGVRSGTGAVLSPTDGSRQAFPEVAGGDVRAAVSDGEGGWYIGGSFTYVGGAPHVGLARILGDGSVDSDFNPAATDFAGNPAAVDALAYSDPAGGWPDSGTLYVGGEFSRIGLGPGEIHAHVAALNGEDGSAITSWGPATDCTPQPSCSAAVRALALAHVPLTVGSATHQAPVLFVGGDFTNFGQSDAPPQVPGLGAVWGQGALKDSGESIAGVSIASGTTPWGRGLGVAAPSVRALQLSGGTTADLAVYVGGAGGTPSAALLEAHQFRIGTPASRSADNPGDEFGNWKPAVDCTGPDCTPTVNALGINGSTVYFAGDFSNIQVPPPGEPVPAQHVAKIGTVSDPADTSAPATPAAPVGDGVDGPVRALAVSNNGSTLYLAGDFTERLAAIDTASESRTGWDPAPDAPAEALATNPSTSSVYAGGRFTSLGSVARGGLAAFDSTGALTDWGPSATASSGSPHVRALAASDSTVYVGGRFDGVADPAGTPHTHANLAAIDAASGVPVDGFDPAPSGDSAEVLSLSLLDSTLYAGGRFHVIGGQVRDNLAALDAASGAATGWNPGADDNVYTLLPACSTVYAGGAFTHAGGEGRQARNYLAALDPVTGIATEWNPKGADATVLSLAQYGSTIYAGGNFAHIGGKLRHKIAALDVRDGTVGDFDADAGGPVRAIAPSGDAVYVGGPFADIGGADRAYLAALDPATGHAAGWAPTVDGNVRALTLAGDNLYAAGDFSTVGAFQQQGFGPFTAGPGETPTPPPCFPKPEPPPAAPPAPIPAPPPCVATIGRSTAEPRRMLRGGRSLTLRFRLTCSATVRLRFERHVSRRALKRCQRNRRRAHPRRCSRYVRFADVKRRGHQGANRVVFKRQRVGRRTLVPGRYRVTLAILPVRPSGARPRAHFTVMPRKRR